MQTCRIVHRDGILSARILERRGDYALTRHLADPECLTHLATGMHLYGDAYTPISLLMLLLEDVQALPRFDLQSYQTVRPLFLAAIERARARHRGFAEVAS